MTQEQLDKIIQQRPDLTLAEIRDLRKEVVKVEEEKKDG
jgi:hypothetical protein